MNATQMRQRNYSYYKFKHLKNLFMRLGKLQNSSFTITTNKNSFHLLVKVIFLCLRKGLILT